MKFAVLLGALAALLQGSTLSAARLEVEFHGLTYAYFFVPGQTDPEFDTFDFHFESSSGTILPPRGLLNGVSTPGEGGTGFNQALATPEFLGGEGLSYVGGQATPDYVTQSWASLGGTIDLPSRYFIGNFELSAPVCTAGNTVVGTMEMYQSGLPVISLSKGFYETCPSPTAASLAAMALTAGPLGRRRERRQATARWIPLKAETSS